MYPKQEEVDHLAIGELRVSSKILGLWGLPIGKTPLCFARDLTLPKTDNAVGIDLGITSLVTLSTGEKANNPKVFDRHDQRLRWGQKP